MKIILGNRYKSHKQALSELDLETLDNRRENLCIRFARKCVKYEKTAHMFPIKENTHSM